MIGETAELLLANETFYEAFASGDLAAMDTLWASHVRVSCAHPGRDVLVGRDDVMTSWRLILSGGGTPGFHCERPHAVLLGDPTAPSGGVVTCLECFDGAQLLATNVFTIEDGRWHMVHHHAGPFGR